MSIPYTTIIMKNDLISGNHCVFRIYYHLIFVTKYRRKALSAIHLRYLKVVLTWICSKNNYILIEFNGERDHVHLLVSAKPSVSISVLVGKLKGISSYALRKYYRALRRVHSRHLWSPSYFVSTVGGANLKQIQQYIKNQKTPAPKEPERPRRPSGQRRGGQTVP